MLQIHRLTAPDNISSFFILFHLSLLMPAASLPVRELFHLWAAGWNTLLSAAIWHRPAKYILLAYLQLSSILPLPLILAQSSGFCFSSLFLHLQHPAAEPTSWNLSSPIVLTSSHNTCWQRARLNISRSSSKFKNLHSLTKSLLVSSKETELTPSAIFGQQQTIT